MIPQKPEQFGIVSWALHVNTPGEMADRLGELGLKKVQLGFGHLTGEGPWKNVGSELAKHGITIVSGCFGTKGEDYSTLDTIRQTGGFVPDQHWEENLRVARQSAQIAADLGLSVVSAHAGFLPPDRKDPAFTKLIGRLSRVADAFARKNVTLIFETGQETADTLWQFLDALIAKGHGNVGVNFDPANMILYDKGDPIASLRRLMPRVKQCHIKDAVRTKTPGTWGTEVAIGEGEVDWKSFMRVLAEADFTGNLVIEREAGADRVGDVRKAIDRISALM